MSNFHSILFVKDDGTQNLSDKEPEFFYDLNLNSIIDVLIRSKEKNSFETYFYNPCHDLETIVYRQDVMKDIERLALAATLADFVKSMEYVHRYLKTVKDLEYGLFKIGWFLEATLAYVEAIDILTESLENASLKSQGLKGLRKFLINYRKTKKYAALKQDSTRIKKNLSEIKYSIIIQNSKFKVKRYENETDYSLDIEKIFEKFKQGDADNYLVKVSKSIGMGYIEAKILSFVAKLYPAPFDELKEFYTANRAFIDKTIQKLDKESQFYLAYLDFIAAFKDRGMPFCYPKMEASRKDEFVIGGFDLALAYKWRKKDKEIVLNDYYLTDPERIIIVTGPNQGGKTTFARMYGQLHYLASLGLPIPGRDARLFLHDHIFTHFEREEDIRSLHGKLEDGLIRIHNILQKATSNSIFIVNEIFASTTLEDAVFLSKKILTRISDLDALCVWVTFIDGLSALNMKTASMVALVDPEDSTKRTYKIVRRPADGLAYAAALVKKHRLTEDEIRERIQQ